MSKLAKAMIYILVASSFGCASYRPIVDTKGVDRVAYENDLKECRAYAEQVDPGANAAAGAVGGAVFGVLVSALLGGSRNYGAAMGATSGASAGAGASARSQIAIVRNCMAGRGYKVLH
jgi:hypothetical protein